MTTAGRFLEVARGEIGYREGRNNDNKYGDWYGYPNVAWCAQFVSWVADRAGLLGAAVPKYQWTPSGATWFKDRGRYGTTPRVGAVGFVYYPSKGRIGHTFIVEKVYNDGTIDTIEGNTNNSGSRIGIGVFRLRRKVNSRLTFGYPDFDQADDRRRKRRLTVWSGATLSAIAAAAGVTVPQIMAENPDIDDPDEVDAGQEITLPAWADPVEPPNQAEPNPEPDKPEPDGSSSDAPSKQNEHLEPMRLNDEGPHVRKLEVCLNESWGLPEQWVDGYFGTETAEATNRVIRSDLGRLAPADGVAGPLTRQAACGTDASNAGTGPLTLNDRGQHVRSYEQCLHGNGWGLSARWVDGHFGTETAAATDRVIRSDLGRLAPADGVAGPLTQQAACDTEAAAATGEKLRYGSEGAAVREIQAGLQALGYNQAVTGWFGPVTARNVDDWVRRQGNLGAADGTAGPYTQASIQSAANR